MLFSRASFLPALIALVSYLFPSSQALLQSTGSTELLDGIPYFVHPQPVTTLQGSYVPDFSGKGTGLLALTVVTTDSLQYGAADLDATSQVFAGLDDVWQSGFLEGQLIVFSPVML